MKHFLLILICLASTEMNSEIGEHKFNPTIQQIAQQKEEKLARLISKIKVDVEELKIKSSK